MLTFLLSQHNGDMTGSYQLTSKVVPHSSDYHLDMYVGKEFIIISRSCILKQTKEEVYEQRNTQAPRDSDLLLWAAARMSHRITVNFLDFKILQDLVLSTIKQQVIITDTHTELYSIKTLSYIFLIPL